MHKICFVLDRREFDREAHEKAGYQVFSPYRDRTILGRLLREFWFRILPFPQTPWYDKQILKGSYQYIVVNDSLITPEYLRWLTKVHPQAKVIYRYANLIGRARNLHPSEVPEGIPVITYDGNDAQKYGIGHLEKGAYIFGRGETPKEPLYDLLYIGRDKGRGEYLLKLEKELNGMGLRTKFLIMPNGRFYIPKPYYSKPISYQRVLELLGQSRAVLNIVLEGQNGVTMRDFESAFRRVKLVTNNKEITQHELFLKENVFVLGESDLSEIRAFLQTPPVDVPEEIIGTYSMGAYVERLIRLSQK